MIDRDHLKPARSPSSRYIALFAWLFAAGLFFSLAKQWIEFSSSDKQLMEYAQSVLQRAALDNRSATDLQSILLLRAEELSIPVQRQQIQVTRQGESVRTVIGYDAEIKVPLVNRVAYRMEFRHNLSNHPPR
jgi:hypothetical protein